VAGTQTTETLGGGTMMKIRIICQYLLKENRNLQESTVHGGEMQMADIKRSSGMIMVINGVSIVKHIHGIIVTMIR